jgi:hypothetical protein
LGYYNTVIISRTERWIKRIQSATNNSKFGGT